MSISTQPGLDASNRPPVVDSYAAAMRGELFAVERFEQLGASLAAAHSLTHRRVSGRNLLQQLAANRLVLLASYRSTVTAVQERRWISPAADWLINNFHVIQEQMRECREDLPAKYYRGLPTLVGGPHSGLPRVYGMAVDFITHCDGKLEIETLRRFVVAYQGRAPLSIGEVWAVPIAMRLAFVENLARIAAKVDRARDERAAAADLADELIRTAARVPEEVKGILHQLVAKRRAPSTTMFASELLLRLRDQDPALAPAIEWLESRIVQQGATVDEATRLEHQSQAQNQVSVGNAITSMRLITSTDWTAFFEGVSAVDAVLREDPSAHYTRMEFATRDEYRHIVERIAKRTRVDEVMVARGAIQLARDGAADDDPRRAHVGYYLVSEGRAGFDAATGYRRTLREVFSQWVKRHAAAFYLGLFSLVTALLVGGAVWHVRTRWLESFQPWLIAILVALPATELALSLINVCATLALAPNTLAKLDFSRGLPPECRTFVVVPTMLTSDLGVGEMIEALEVRYLANQDPCIHFALLTDFADSQEQQAEGDARLLELARRGIERLNAIHGPANDRFYLFHRPRVWSDSEQSFIGWERKRGKLVAFNRLLLGGPATEFHTIIGDQSVFSTVRYVLTLDSDTGLPRGAASRLIGAMAHPLNAPQRDERTQTVKRGHGIIQPRVSVSLESAGRSRFARLFSGQVGIDPYTTAVSDVYQDLFGEGSFVGKGLYDVRAFEAALEGRVPENAVLSHDLLEGSLARSALAADIELFDDSPSQYLVHAMRRHRWTRGDWQLTPWLFGSAPMAGNAPANVLSVLARWKIADNLRRSLVAPTMLLLLITGWSGWLGPPGIWTLVVVLLVAFPAYAHLTTSMISAPRGVTLPSYLGNLGAETARNAAQSLLTLTFLPHQSSVSVDAIARVLVRRLLTHRKLLEWEPAGLAEGRGVITTTFHYRRMWSSVAFALAAMGLLVCWSPAALPIALPFIVAWLLAPFIAARLSRPTVEEPARLTQSDQRFLRTTARKTWRYFETFVTAVDNFLPPDNFQEKPAPVLAHRTSPTNIGLSLLADLVAVDRAYATLSEGTDRVSRTLGAMDRLERYRGHFLNWYDTSTMRPLMPQYISTVDSGNLAGHLFTLKQGLIKASARPLLSQRIMDGLLDTVWLLEAETSKVSAVRHWAGDRLLRPLEQATEAMAGLLEAHSFTVKSWPSTMLLLAESADGIAHRIQEIAVERGTADLVDLTFWGESLVRQLASRRAEMMALSPWLVVLSLAAEERAPSALCKEIMSSLGEPTSASTDELARWGELVRGWALGKLNGEQTWSTDEQLWLTALAEAADQGVERVEALDVRLSGLAKRAHELAHEMDFSFLYDRDRKVFSIGYNLADSRLDASFYDLLASESRLASFVAIAKGDVPSAHWYRLGRPLGQLGSRRALLSWTGTMFEYLMPCLVMKTYAGTLLDRTCRAVIRRQIDYGEQLGVPWGTSEAAYNARDLQLNYQYGPFGVPGLGIKRGLGDEIVVAPYASALALQFAPEEAVHNLRRLAHAGLDGRYGFYESIDYTPSRLEEGQTSETVRAFMAHHQGMTLVAIAEHLDGGTMRERFHADPSVQATQLLLQERMPHHVPLAELNQQESTVLRSQVDATPNRYGLAFDVDGPPEVHLLSNGVYSVMVTTSGAGSSRCRGLMITRWREDATRDHWGQFCYLRDVESGRSWSTTYQPMLGKPRAYEVDVDLDKAEFRRVENGIASRVVISVSSEDNAELRSIKLTNLAGTTREVELTTYAEIVLATASADSAHPTFGNLFVHTEFLPGSGALLATRRPRSASDATVWAVHVSAMDGVGAAVGPVQYETDRARFLGRGRGPNAPIAVVDDRPLSNTVGPVLDPIFSLRRRLRLAPGQSVQVVFTTAVAETRAQAIVLAEKYQHAEASRRASELAWTNARAELHYLNIGGEETRIFSRLASRMIYASRYLRSSPELLARNEGCQADLWRYGISGDLPILAVRVSVDGHIELVRQLLHAHEYWRRRGFQVDLVVLNEHAASYLQSFQDQIISLVRSSMARELLDRPGGVFVLRNDLMSEKDRTLVRTVARVVLAGERGTILEQVERTPPAQPLPPPLAPRRPVSGSPAALISSKPRQLAKETEYFNGSGGFADEGGEYRIALTPHQWTPVPWSNVIANARFGTLVTDSGGGYTWCDNSRENRLTPWSNDPVTDGVGEAIYVRDEDTGAFFTPTALPVRGPQPYQVRHGQGYSVFETAANGLELSLLVCVPTEDPVKLSKLTLRNRFPVKRRLTVTYYVEWTLGVLREASAPYVVTSITRGSVLTARNAYNNEFAASVAFMSASAAIRSFTGDRCEFIGGGGHLGKPAAMSRDGLSGRVGAGLDPCGALQIDIELAPGEEHEVVFTLGEGLTLADAERLAMRYRAPMSVADALSAARAGWSDVLDTIQVQTPDTPFDYLVNRWLLYQTMGCRLWARTGFYQSGGAYGFRDQLQDVAALVYAAPQIARAQLLRAAARQFVEGDVQHWWHPPTGRGVRTRFSDDLLWLPYVLSHYLEVTGDAAVLDEAIPFIEARPLAENEDDAYLVPSVSETEGSLYEHCVRALDRSLVTGTHGLPLIGSGDWNDGMNRVGHHGRGESVWLAWFLHATLVKFAPVCRQRGDATRAARYLAHAATLVAAVEEEAWDGEWYTRAYMDDGTPLGSSRGAECQIDSIAQTWSVISGAGNPARQKQAMASVEKHLVKQKDELILLFTPPFDKTDIDPGYIKGYLPGTRENGGQYTHAAVWVVLAYALLGDGNRAGELFALLNPVNRTATRAGAQRYKVEPYVIAADVYSQPPHTGRGGWTWYTGSASWMYRVAVEAMLGLRLRGDTLLIEPCVPSTWPQFTIVYRHHQTTYRIVVENPDRVCRGVRALELDGASVGVGAIALVRDGQEHTVRVTLGA